MNFLHDVITYVRRIVKTPSNSVLTDSLIIDYINRFYIMDVDARIQLFDLKKKYQFQTTPGVDKYNMPLYTFQPSVSQPDIGMYPVYQGFLGPAYVNGVQVSFHTQKHEFFKIFPNIMQYMQAVEVGDGTVGPYYLKFPITPNFPSPPQPPSNGLIRGHVDTSGIIAIGLNVDPPLSETDVPNAVEKLRLNIPVTSVDSQVFITATGTNGANITVQDSGQFMQQNQNLGLLMTPGKAPLGNLPLGQEGPDLTNAYKLTQNVVNYFTGEAWVNFPQAIPQGNNINVQALYYQTGLPRSILFYDNTLTLRVPPDKQYLVELDAYLSPAAFMASSEALPFGYMAEYMARGAARKILSDTGDVEQFQFYEPLFREQEDLVHIRSQRQWTANRTETIYSQGVNQGWIGYGTTGAGNL